MCWQPRHAGGRHREIWRRWTEKSRHSWWPRCKLWVPASTHAPLYGTERYQQREIVRPVKNPESGVPRVARNPMHERILGAAFKAFAEEGYAATSTLEIATRAKVSKRDLYANFRSKQEVLAACIRSGAERMRLAPDFPIPDSRQMLAATLTAYAANLVREVS